MDEHAAGHFVQKRAAPSEEASRSKRAKYTAAACDICKKRKLRCVPSDNGGRCQRCEASDLVCVFEMPSRQQKPEVDSDQLGLLLGEMAALRRQVSDLASAVNELRRGGVQIAAGTAGTSFADAPNTQAPGLRRKPQFVGSTQPDYDFQVGEQALHRMGLPTNQEDETASESNKTGTSAVVGEAADATSTVADSTTQDSSAALGIHWTADEVVRLLGVYGEDVNSVYPLLDMAGLATQPQAILADVQRCLQQQASVLLPDTRASADAGDAALARVVLATAVVLESGGRNAVSDMLVSPVERNVSCIASPEADLKEVQLLGAMSLYYFHIDQDLLAWRAISVAAHETLEMGLHRKQSLLDNYREPSRCLVTRVFWCVYMLDRRWSIGISLPFTLHDRDLDPGLPEPSDFPYLQCMVRYGRLCSELWDTIPVLPGGVHPPLPDDRAGLLDQRVQKWLAEIPGELQLRHPRLGLAPQVQPRVLHRLRTLLYLRANSLRILLHRHRLRSPAAIDADPRGAWLVVDIAMDSIQVLSHLHTTTDLYTRQQRAFNYFLLSALAVIFLAVCHAPRTFTEPCRRTFGEAVALIRCFSRDSTMSRRLWNSIRGLLPALRKLGMGDHRGRRVPSPMAGVSALMAAETTAVPSPYSEQQSSTAVASNAVASDDRTRVRHPQVNHANHVNVNHQAWDQSLPLDPLYGALEPLPNLLNVDSDLLYLFDWFGQGQQLLVDDSLQLELFSDGPLVGEGGGISERFQELI